MKNRARLTSARPISVFLAVACTASATASARTSDAAPATLTVGPDLVVAGTIAGRPARLQMSPNGSSTLVMNPDAANRMGLKGGLFNVGVKVGPVAIRGKTAVVRYGVQGPERRRRIGWFDRPIAQGFDGMLGPAAVSQPVVIFQLRQPVAGERRSVLPLTDRGYGGMGTMVTVGGQPIFVEWALTKPHNGATAAAATMAAALGGQFAGRGWREPLAFDVERPVRRLTLARPLAIGPLQIGSLVTRTGDYGDTSAIPDADADPSEIVVTGRWGNRIRSIRWKSAWMPCVPVQAWCSTSPIDRSF